MALYRQVRSSIKAFPWVQVADLKCGLPKKTYPWVIGIMQNEVLFVQCKGRCIYTQNKNSLVTIIVLSGTRGRIQVS
jgi:hypothetical protein